MTIRKSTKIILALAVIALLIAGGWLLSERLLRGPVPTGVPTAAPTGDGWVNLLDNAHLGGWKNAADKKEIFEVSENSLHIFGRTIYPLRYATYTAEKYGNFDLHVEFKVTKRANSGVFVRMQPDDPLSRGFEVQVLDDYGTPPNKNGSGAIYDVVTPMFNMARPAGEWNSYDIHVHGADVIIEMNGWMVVHTDLSKMTMPIGKFKNPYSQMPVDGYIALQDHGGEVWYRNILVKRAEQ